MMDFECTPRYERSENTKLAEEDVFITQMPATMRNPRTEDSPEVRISTVKDANKGK